MSQMTGRARHGHKFVVRFEPRAHVVVTSRKWQNPSLIQRGRQVFKETMMYFPNNFQFKNRKILVYGE